MHFIYYAIVAIESASIVLVLAPIIIKCAEAWKIYDYPGNRKIHNTPTPLLGGVSVFIAIFITVIGNVSGFHLLKHTSFVQNQLVWIYKVSPMLDQVTGKLIVILGGGVVIFVMGLLDDIYGEKITYQIKLIIQVLVALGVTLLGIRVNFMPGEFLDVVITTLWIVGITNSFNFIDNLDGLMSGFSVIAGVLLFVIALLQGQIFFAFLLVSIVGACAGFLKYNFYPAKVFMGDSGSQFLGYMFAALTVTGSYIDASSQSFLPILIPVLVLSIPLYDIFSVMFIRWREGRSLFLGDKRHFSHRLLDLGMTQSQTAIFIYLVGLCVGGAAILLPYISFAGNIVILLQAIIVYILITFLIIIGKQNNNEKVSSFQEDT